MNWMLGKLKSFFQELNEPSKQMHDHSTASVGKLNKNLVLLHELIKVELPLWKIEKADVSSLSPLAERMAKG